MWAVPAELPIDPRTSSSNVLTESYAFWHRFMISAADSVVPACEAVNASVSATRVVILFGFPSVTEPYRRDDTPSRSGDLRREHALLLDHLDEFKVAPIHLSPCIFAFLEEAEGSSFAGVRVVAA